MSLLKCENLSFAYDGVTVVRDLNFTVEEGNYLCIIGENGAGKSTLIKGLLRLKKPSAGKVELGEGLRATEIGYLPQQTQIQKDFPASVREVVLSGCLNRMGLRPFYTRTEKERARENMEALEILELQDQCYRDLSGGQQQRVLLARAMCAAQKMILLDEPVSGLDPVATRSLYAQIARINETAGLTVIMVSHDIDASLRYASHILHLGQEGQLFFGTQKEYRRSAVYHDFLGDRAVPMWKHEFPNRVGRAAPREEAEPTETESRVKVFSGRKSSRRLKQARSESPVKQDEPVQKAADGISGGQADALFLLIVNNAADQISIISIHRNTMTTVKMYDQAGEYTGDRELQICLQHGRTKSYQGAHQKCPHHKRIGKHFYN